MRINRCFDAPWKSPRPAGADDSRSAIVSDSRSCIAVRLRSFPNRSITEAVAQLAVLGGSEEILERVGFVHRQRDADHGRFLLGWTFTSSDPKKPW